MKPDQYTHLTGDDNREDKPQPLPHSHTRIARQTRTMPILESYSSIVEQPSGESVLYGNAGL